jgi:hypothetical protein
MRLPAAGALACALAALCAAAPAQARPQAVIALLPPGPGETRPLLEELAARGMAIGMTSPTVGGFKARQMGLDMSQGARIPTRLYSGPIGALRLQGGRLTGWALALRRAEKAPGDLEPGLLASTIESARGRVGLGGDRRGYSIAPIVAANRRGQVSSLQPGDALGVFQLAPGAAGLHELDQLLAARGKDDLVYVVRAPYGKELRLLPSGLAAPGIHGQLRSATTRRTGLISATDVAPTVLRTLGVPVPHAMQGEPIAGRGARDPKAVEQLADRLAVVTSRRVETLRWLAGAWLALLAVLQLSARERGLRAAMRIGALAALWVPGLALLTAALEPSREVEAAIVGLGAVLLGAITDRLARWPRGPAIAVGVVFVAHAVDLARGSDLIGTSLAGPNPAGGARFFGIGNELEVILSVSILFGTGAALAWRDRRAPVVFAAVAIITAGIIGAGRLGADVGAVITLGAGGAAAVVASLPGRPSLRAIALGIVAPVAAIGVLILIDLVTGGDAHLTRSVLHAQSAGDVGDVIRRRFTGSFTTLANPGWAVAFALAVAAMAWLAARQHKLRDGVPRSLAAGAIGGWFAVLIGTLANDSGPLILVIGAILLLLATGYARCGPRPASSHPGS